MTIQFANLDEAEVNNLEVLENLRIDNNSLSSSRGSSWTLKQPANPLLELALTSVQNDFVKANVGVHHLESRVPVS